MRHVTWSYIRDLAIMVNLSLLLLFIIISLSLIGYLISVLGDFFSSFESWFLPRVGVCHLKIWFGIIRDPDVESPVFQYHFIQHYFI